MLVIVLSYPTDYSDSTGEISVSIFDDRLEVWNNGRLHGGLTIEKLKTTHPSRRPNPKIAEVFYSCGYIDRWGTGTLRVLSLCKEFNLPEPDFKEENLGILAIIQFMQQKIQSTGINLTERQLAVFECFKQNQKMTFEEVKSHLQLDISDRTLRNELSVLRKHGLISLSGRGQNAIWFLES